MPEKPPFRSMDAGPAGCQGGGEASAAAGEAADVPWEMPRCWYTQIRTDEVSITFYN